MVVGVEVQVHRQTDLLQIVFGLRASGRGPRLLNRRQDERRQNPDDGDYDQQFDQCET
jgi:hypothetical protein